MSTPLRLACVSLALLASVSSAQSPNYARPTTVSAGQFIWESASPGLPGVALSPDGRLLICARFANQSPPMYPEAGWWAAVLRPEAVTQDASGIPQFPSVPLNLSGPSAWSGASLVEQNDVLPNTLPTPAPTSTYPTPNHMFNKQWLAMCPDPAFASRPCPFPSDVNGTPGDPGTPSGQFETYRMLVVGADQWNGVDTSSSNNFLQPTFVTPGGVDVMPIGMRTLRVTVSSPQTTTAAIASTFVSANFDVLQWQSTTNGPQPILGLEPTLSRDGRLLVFQGNVANSGRAWNSARTEGQQLLYSFNPTPGVSTGWSEPHPLNAMNALEANRIVNGMRFVDLYPIAAQPLVNSDGTPLTPTQPFSGAYPWMTLDATDLVFSAARNGEVPGSFIRRGVSLIGHSTGYALRHVDGPLNPDRDHTDRILTTGSGLTPGAWRWGGDKLGLALPYTRQGTVISLFDAQMRRYDEISLREKLDGDYLVAWDMNELIHEDATLGWRIEHARTADTSGNLVTGTLSTGAFFPIEAGMGDVNYGAVGRSVIMTGSAAVTGSGGGVLASARPALSIECWFQQLWNAQPASLVSKAGSYELATDPQGRVRVTLVTTAGTLQTPWAGPVQTVQDWRHVAFAFDGASQRLFVYVDGLLVHTMVTPAGAAVAGTSAPLVVGPAGINVGGGGPPGGYVALDQLLISRVARTADELERDAFRPPAASTLQTLPTTFPLPLGLDRAETRVPIANVPTRKRIDLGEILFKDGGLSPSGVSCSKCHELSRDFTDGLARPVGSATGVKLRNTQTVLNRGFSSEQFWDGRAATLEEQVLHPLLSPEEMNSTKIFALNYLTTSTNPNYGILFQGAFGGLPSIDRLQEALASYERALVAGNSPADQFEAGSATLTASEKRGRDLFLGKARCFGCHTGSNYSDERYHVALFPSSNGAGTGADRGRGAVNGRTHDLDRFKTPTLRNLAQTAPYFHDGRAATLLDVVNTYDAGSTLGGAVDEEIFPLGLTSTEKLDLVAFLLSLSGGWQKL